MKGPLQTTIKQHWKSLGLKSAPRELSLHLSGDGGVRGRAIARIFVGENPRPALLAKLPRDGGARSLATREHDLLQSLAEAAPRLAGRRFPRALLRTVDAGRLITFQSVLTGAPLGRQLDGSAAESSTPVFRTAREWLTEFWRGTGLLAASEAALWDPFLRALRFHREHGAPEGDEARTLEELELEITARHNETALAGFGHGDFRPDNLCVRGDQTGAVDWEHGAARQFPWVDPVCFALDVAREFGRRWKVGGVAAYDSAFRTEGVLRAVTRNFLGLCLAEGGVPEDDLRLALPSATLMLAHRAARRHSPDHVTAREWREIARHALLTRQETGSTLRG